MSVKQVIVIRKGLNMRKGKMVAQGAHASLMQALVDYIEAAFASGLRRVASQKKNSQREK